MNQKVNKVYKPLFFNKSRYTILMGGRGAGRSTVASQFALSHLISDQFFRCAIMRYILGDIRNSIFREITDRIDEAEIENSVTINNSLMHIDHGNNSINAVGFKKSSSDQRAKLKSLANYNCVIIEEADEIPEEDFMQLDDSLRTVKGDIKIILLLNPPAKTHWIIRRWFDLLPSDTQDFYAPKLKADIIDTTFIHTSYHDNKLNLDSNATANYENYKTSKPAHYHNMVRGLVPEVVQGKIYSNWVEIEDIPHEARLERYGVDFGYTNDPTSIVALYYYNGGYILDEVVYKKGMSNKEIADTLNSLKSALVIADSAEPKSIDEIRSYGVNILPAQKGRDSINQGIQYVQDQQISMTKRSRNGWKEYENYAWKINKDGIVINTPIEQWNHFLDGVRYAFDSLKPEEEEYTLPSSIFNSTGFY